MIKKLKNYSSIQSLLMTAVLFPAVLIADDHHLFPSDIIDEAEKANYELERAERYTSQRQWSFPQTIRSSTPDNYPTHSAETNSGRYPDSNQYITIDGKIPGQIPEYGASQLTEPAPFQYNELNPGASNRFGPDSSVSRQYYEPSGQTGAVYYPQNNPARQYERSRSQAPDYNHPVTYPQNDYAGGNYSQGNPAQNTHTYQQYDTQEHNLTDHNLLFPGDVESRNNTQNKRFEPFSYQTGTAQESNRNNEQIRYIPVPVYNVPGTLPGTVPGMVTPSNMVPGYSHLNPYGNNQGIVGSPFNQYGLNNMWGTPYNPFGTFGGFPGSGFPGIVNPFNSYYNNNGNNSFNNMPFTNPGFMMPGLSVPDRDLRR